MNISLSDLSKVEFTTYLSVHRRVRDNVLFCAKSVHGFKLTVINLQQNRQIKIIMREEPLKLLHKDIRLTLKLSLVLKV